MGCAGSRSSLSGGGGSGGGSGVHPGDSRPRQHGWTDEHFKSALRNAGLSLRPTSTAFTTSLVEPFHSNTSNTTATAGDRRGGGHAVCASTGLVVSRPRGGGSTLQRQHSHSSSSMSSLASCSSRDEGQEADDERTAAAAQRERAELESVTSSDDESQGGSPATPVRPVVGGGVMTVSKQSSRLLLPAAPPPPPPVAPSAAASVAHPSFTQRGTVRSSKPVGGVVVGGTLEGVSGTSSVPYSSVVAGRRGSGSGLVSCGDSRSRMSSQSLVEHPDTSRLTILAPAIAAAAGMQSADALGGSSSSGGEEDSHHTGAGCSPNYFSLQVHGGSLPPIVKDKLRSGGGGSRLIDTSSRLQPSTLARSVSTTAGDMSPVRRDSEKRSSPSFLARDDGVCDPRGGGAVLNTHQQRRPSTLGLSARSSRSGRGTSKMGGMPSLTDVPSHNSSLNSISGSSRSLRHRRRRSSGRSSGDASTSGSPRTTNSKSKSSRTPPEKSPRGHHTSSGVSGNFLMGGPSSVVSRKGPSGALQSVNSSHSSMGSGVEESKGDRLVDVDDYDPLWDLGGVSPTSVGNAQNSGRARQSTSSFDPLSRSDSQTGDTQSWIRGSPSVPAANGQGFLMGCSPSPALSNSLSPKSSRPSPLYSSVDALVTRRDSDQSAFDGGILYKSLDSAHLSGGDTPASKLTLLQKRALRNREQALLQLPNGGVLGTPSGTAHRGILRVREHSDKELSTSSARGANKQVQFDPNMSVVFYKKQSCVEYISRAQRFVLGADTAHHRSLPKDAPKVLTIQVGEEDGVELVGVGGGGSDDDEDDDLGSAGSWRQKLSALTFATGSSDGTGGLVSGSNSSSHGSGSLVGSPPHVLGHFQQVMLGVQDHRGSLADMDSSGALHADGLACMDGSGRQVEDEEGDGPILAPEEEEVPGKEIQQFVEQHPPAVPTGHFRGHGAMGSCGTVGSGEGQTSLVSSSPHSSSVSSSKQDSRFTR